MTQSESIANNVLNELNNCGIKCYLWHKAQTGSIYIRFEDQRIGSIRIGDHAGREKLKYKFNIRSDIKYRIPKWVKDKNIWRVYVHTSKWRAIIPIIVNRSHEVKKWTFTRYRYGVPSFKKNISTNK